MLVQSGGDARDRVWRRERRPARDLREFGEFGGDLAGGRVGLYLSSSRTWTLIGRFGVEEDPVLVTRERVTAFLRGKVDRALQRSGGQPGASIATVPTCDSAGQEIGARDFSGKAESGQKLQAGRRRRGWKAVRPAASRCCARSRS